MSNTIENKQGESLFYKIVLWAAAISAFGLTLFPVIDLFLARFFWRGLPQAAPLKEHAMIGITFFAAAVAGIKGKQLSLGTGSTKNNLFTKIIGYIKDFLSTSIDFSLTIAAISLLFVGFEPNDKIFFIPKAIFASPIAIGFLFLTINDIKQAGKKGWIFSVLGIIFALFLSTAAINNIISFFGIWNETLYALSESVTALISSIKYPIIIVLILTAFMGLPLYMAISGAALFLFIGSYGAIELIPSEAYNLLKNDSMPAIPLFTLAGFVLSESKAGKRLVALFREWFGWLPGGEAFAAVLVCAFFTTFTGANGVAILALGGILSTVLIGSKVYSEDFTHGFLTASSSVGLLFPPSMAIILYAVNATFVVQGEAAFSIMDMFMGGLLPGVLLVLGMTVMAIFHSTKQKKLIANNESGIQEKKRFNLKLAGSSFWTALPEIMIPIIILVLYLTGFAAISEISGLILIYVIVVEGPIRKDLDFKGIVKAIKEAIPVLGGSLIIIAAARGLSFYMMQAGLPELFTSWMTSVVSSKTVFLLLLNLALLLVGCFMDIFSAVLVISPMVIPLGAAYGVNPVHLGVIFIANLSIGFMTPPIGMNLFLASYAFNKPILRIYKDVWPFLLVQLVILALITWVPWFSLAFL